MESLSAISGADSQSVLSSQGGKFGSDTFLQILVTQMQNQTPLSPVDNGQFLEQMASYSSMSEQRELNQNMLDLLNFQGLLARLQGLSEGSSLLGKELTYDVGSGIPEKGIAESVFVNEGGEVRVITGGKEISVQQITGVAQAPTN